MILCLLNLVKFRKILKILIMKFTPSPSAIPQWCMPKILSGDVKSILRQPVCEWDRAVEGFIIFKSMNQEKKN